MRWLNIHKSRFPYFLAEEFHTPIVRRTSVYFWVMKKLMATRLLIMIVTGSYTIFRKENWSCSFAKHCECSVFIEMLLSTHLFFKDSQLKQMNYRSLWFSVTCGIKETEWPLQLSTYIFPRIDLRIEDQRSFFGKFPFLKE